MKTNNAFDADDAEQPDLGAPGPIGHRHDPATQPATGSESVADPVTVVTRFLHEVLDGGDYALLDELWADDMSWHGGSLGEFHTGPNGRQRCPPACWRRFSGMHLDVHDVVAQGDTVRRGRTVDAWFGEDIPDMMQQLGLSPTPAVDGNAR